MTLEFSSLGRTMEMESFFDFFFIFPIFSFFFCIYGVSVCGSLLLRLRSSLQELLYIGLGEMASDLFFFCSSKS